MPLYHEDTRRTPTPRVVIHGSAVIELEWVLASAEREEFQRDHPTLARFYAARPDLRARVRELWSGSEAVSCGGYIELMVLAHQGGVLRSMDPDEVLGCVESMAAEVAVDAGRLALLSETEEDRAAVLRRLERLRQDGSLRRRYADLLREVWDAVSEDWHQFGRSAVEVAVEGRRRLLSRGAPWREVARPDCDCEEDLEACVAALPGDGELAVVPAFFAHLGLLMDLPGTVVMGVRADTSGLDARARTEALARRLKILSDPTRLAILDTLRLGPRTVTELATSFALAQPTVSNHVKLLRDAGLVSDRREGSRRNLVVEAEAMDELLESLRLTLTAPTGHLHGHAVPQTT